MHATGLLVHHAIVLEFDRAAPFHSHFQNSAKDPCSNHQVASRPRLRPSQTKASTGDGETRKITRFLDVRARARPGIGGGDGGKEQKSRERLTFQAP